jgi:hypothetical protein
VSHSFEKREPADDKPHQKAIANPTTVSPAAASYVRQARRIRRTFCTAPTSRFVALRQLADAHDRAAATPADAPPHRGKDAAVHVFAQIVQANLCGPLLSFSARKRLMAQAERLGISRFDANLVIASVQHHAPGDDGPLAFIAATPDPPRQVAWLRWAGLLAATVAAQIIVVLAIWAMIS